MGRRAEFESYTELVSKLLPAEYCVCLYMPSPGTDFSVASKDNLGVPTKTPHCVRMLTGHGCCSLQFHVLEPLSCLDSLLSSSFPISASSPVSLIQNEPLRTENKDISHTLVLTPAFR